MYPVNVKSLQSRANLKASLHNISQQLTRIIQINGGNRQYNSKNNIADGFLQN